MLTFSRFSRYFVEVAHQGSLRKAAEVLNVSASAIDRQILLAEDTLDIVLFERLPTGLRLTVAGELLLNNIKRWGREYKKTLQQFDELKDLHRGHISVGLINALTDGPFIYSLSEFSRIFPDLTLELTIVDSEQIPQLVQSLEVDFGLLLDPVGLTGMDIRPLATFPIGVAMPIGHPLANKKELSFGQIMDYRHIVPTAPLTTHKDIGDLYIRYHAPDIIHITSNSIRAMRALIRQNAGIGLMGWLDAIPDVMAGRLAFVPLHDRYIKPITLALCIAPQRQLSKAAQTAIEHLSKDLSRYLNNDPVEFSH